MMRILRCSAIVALSVLSMGAARPPAVALWRLDCGTFVTKGLVDSCYLIRHGRDWMLWDAGLSLETLRRPMTRAGGSVVVLEHSIAEQLSQLALHPSDITVLALSHVHFDHIGQAAEFSRARLLLGEPDWERITHATPGSGLEPQRLAPWIAATAPKTLIAGDEDVFGAGSVVMLALPGHTPGHHGLLVRLAHRGPVLLTGDLYDTARRYAEKAPNPHADDPQALSESFRRFNDLVQRLHAQVIIAHEAGDVAKLPAFPRPAS